MNKLYHLDKKYKGYCWDLLNKLFPIHRTILGEGYEQSLEIVNKIRVRNFEYRKPEEIDLSEFPLVTADGRNATCLAQSPTGTQIGVIAQEYEEVLPNSVIVDQSKGNKEVDTDSLIWHLVNSVQELSAQNEALVARITALESN